MQQDQAHVELQERLPDAVWYTTHNIARHVDHQIVCSAADRLIQLGANVKFYEEFPYVLWQGALDARLKELGGAFEPALVEMSEMLHLRQEAAEMYASQMPVIFGTREGMYTPMENY